MINSYGRLYNFCLLAIIVTLSRLLRLNLTAVLAGSESRRGLNI